MPTPRLTPCLWFDNEAEAAANYYVGIFANSRITSVASGSLSPVGQYADMTSHSRRP